MIAALLLASGLALAAPKPHAAPHPVPAPAPVAAPAGERGFSASAETPTAALAAAGTAYEQGRLNDALARYEQLVSGGAMDATLCYNLGNTQWRLGRRGLAIMWWERARRLAPRDADIRFNLALARSSLQDEEPSVWESLDRILTPDELAVLLTVLVWLLGILTGVALWRDLPWPRWRRPVLLAAPLLVLAATWLALRAHDLNHPWGVVVAPTVEIRSGPGDQFPVGYTAPEGQRTLILSRRPGWIEIGVPSKSLKGWVVDSSIAAI
jgi:tetratricopeptide (TPR) repeat protein